MDKSAKQIESKSSKYCCTCCDSVREVFSEVYCSKMKPFTVMAWVYFLIFLALAVFSALKFFAVEDIKEAMMYAVLFLVSILLIISVKIIVLGVAHRFRLSDQVSHVEKSIEDLAQSCRQGEEKQD